MATITSPRPQSPAINTSGRNPSPNIAISSSPSSSLTPSSSVRPSLDLPLHSVSGNGGLQRRDSSPNPLAALAATTQRRNRAALRDYYNLRAKNGNGGTGPPGGPLSRTASIASTTSESTITSTTAAAASSLTPTITITQRHPLAPDSSASSTISEPESLPAQLDATDFDADAYVRELLRTEDLKGVLRIEGLLVSEIRQLDGERKALVYDNYSKLIKATATIGGMRRSLDEGSVAEGELGFGVGLGLGIGGKKTRSGGLKRMEGLRPAIEGVSRVVEELGVGRGTKQGAGEENKKKAAERRKVREKKELVRWVLGAPQRMDAMLEDGNEDDIKREWEEVREVLDSWKNVRGVKEIKSACLAIMEKAEPDAEAHESDTG